MVTRRLGHPTIIPMAKNVKKTVGIVAGVILGATLIYFSGGVIVERLVANAVFNHRSPEPNDPKNHKAGMYLSQKDFPALSTRVELTFVSGGNTLTGYYYDTPSKDVVLFAHGMNSYADGPEAVVENYFVEAGYDVFAIDLSASGKSEGTSMVNLYQSAYDVAAAERYLRENNRVTGSLILSGYSWGGFGAAASLGLGAKADKLLTFSAYDCPYEMMIHSASERVGQLSVISVPCFALSTLMFHGENNFRKASDAVKSAGIPAMLIQGSEDKMVPLSGISLYDHCPDAVRYEVRGGHEVPWVSVSARQYVENTVKPELAKQEAISEEKAQEYLAGLDKKRTSDLDVELFLRIDDFLRTGK